MSATLDVIESFSTFVVLETYSPDSYIYISRHLKVLQPLRSLASITCSSQSLSDASDILANQRLPSRPGKKQRNRKELSIIQGLILETTMKSKILYLPLLQRSSVEEFNRIQVFASGVWGLLLKLYCRA